MTGRVEPERAEPEPEPEPETLLSSYEKVWIKTNDPEIKLVEWLDVASEEEDVGDDIIQRGQKCAESTRTKPGRGDITRFCCCRQNDV